MALSNNEQLLVEAIKSLLGGDTRLGLAYHDKHQKGNLDSIIDDSNTFQMLHENIEDQFGLGTIDLPHHNGICSAFHKVHGYKYLTDGTFYEALRAEFNGQAIPKEEQEFAFNLIDKIIKEVKQTKKKASPWNERDAGWNPALDEIIKASQPE